VTTYGYDVYGNVAKQVDPSGTESDYTDVAPGRCTMVSLGATSPASPEPPPSPASSAQLRSIRFV
jgi:hypothetical protein